MSNAVRYAAVNTKIRALEGRLLTEADYKMLLEKETVPDIIRYLEQTDYRHAFEGLEEQSLHRETIEVRLNRYAVDKLVRLRHYFQGNYSKFLKVLLMRYEVQDLKILIRAIHTDRDYIDFPHALVYIGRYGDLDFQKLSASQSFPELVDHLKGTPYYRYLVPLTQGKKSRFQVEMSLDLAYVSIFKSCLELLTRDEKKRVLQIEGMQTDLQNLQWIYRGRKFYHLPPDILLNYSISFGGRMDNTAIRELCYSKDVSGMMSSMKEKRYRFLFQHNRTRDLFMERRISRYLYYRLLEFKRKSSMDIVPMIVYFDLLDFEIRDIITIMENIRYHNEDPDQIKRYLIREL
ncbi:V-type ATPase subunit [Eubacteriales bacterium mix99]|jgi:V/A-type H+-transporting ATPase subunit C